MLHHKMKLVVSTALLQMESYCFCHELTIKDEALMKILDIKMEIVQVI